MEGLIRKYMDKLAASGYAEAGAPLMGAVDADLVWNRDDPNRPLFEEVFAGLNIQSLLYSRPAEPYRTAIDYLAGEAVGGAIFPEDTETRTFFHDLPVAAAFGAGEVVAALRRRKGVIVPGRGIATFGTVSPEQAYVTFCSVCFSAFVKFFVDYLANVRQGTVSAEREEAFQRAVAHLDAPPSAPLALKRGPFADAAAVMEAMAEAGRATVASRMVDSFFGNVSCLSGNVLYISQTGSSLDALEGCIDPVPLDGSSCAGITASSEFAAHRRIVLDAGRRTVLHGHPRFSVILSLDCGRTDCPERGACHIRCPERRVAGGVPVVTGEIGTGPRGLCGTVPPALREHPAVIVHGHGVFAAGGGDFNDAFGALLAVEQSCRREYFRRAKLQ